MKTLIQSAREIRHHLLCDRHRPRYHFVAPEGVHMPFDPNGAFFWKGRYHLMYITQPEKGHHCYAHISSRDLLHWRHHPMALEPGENDTAIFSGGAFVDKNGVPTITYWGLGDKGGVCIATSTDDELDHWTKSPHNPVIPQNRHPLSRAHGAAGYDLTEGEEPYGVADPSGIWIHNGRYYLLTGNLPVLRIFGREQGLEEHKGDTAYLFVSDDLVRWQYLHPFYQSDRKWTQDDEDDMCPDFFPLGDRHMLLFISHNRGCQYYLGQYRDDHFYPEVHGRMTWVDHAFFAPESVADDRGRRIMWAWIHEMRGKEAVDASAWSGTMSLPRLLWLGEDGALQIAPAEELKSLRINLRNVEQVVISPNEEVVIDGLRGNTIELDVEMKSQGRAQLGVKVCCSPDGEEQTTILYDAEDEALKIDTSCSSLGEGPKTVERGPLSLGVDEPLKLRVFVDRSVVEVFANDRQAVVRRIYPTREDSLGVSLFSRNASATARLQSWDMAPTNPW